MIVGVSKKGAVAQVFTAAASRTSNHLGVMDNCETREGDSLRVGKFKVSEVDRSRPIDPPPAGSLRALLAWIPIRRAPNGPGP